MKLKFIIFIIVLVGAGWGIQHKVSASKCPDSDGDDLSDCKEETVYHTERFNPDTDNDGYPDGEEVNHGFSPTTGNNKKLTDVDSDGDGLTDAQELKAGTDLLNPDTDGDGESDKFEIDNKSNPLVAKTEKSSKWSFFKK